MAKILIVEDEKAIAELIELNLSLTGHKCIRAGEAEEAMQLAMSEHPDIVLLDIMLPGRDGFDLIGELRQFNLPVIFLTARNSVVDKVQGLRLGADDYITKPFEPAELLARIDAVLRRSGHRDDQVVICGIEIKLDERSVRRDGNIVDLTAQEFNLLEVLLRNRNIALSREKLLESAWGYDYVGETRTVDIHIQRLRKKLGWDNCLRTVYKYGYRLETDT